MKMPTAQENTASSSAEIQAIIILFGWIGANPKHLQKYAESYSNHSDYKCVTICDTASPTTIIMRNEQALTSLVMNSVQKAAGIIRKVEKERNITDSCDKKVEVPVILHYFSNGGAFVAEHLDQMIKEAKKSTHIVDSAITTSQQSTISENDANDLITVSNRLQNGFEVLDSSPSYLDLHDTGRFYKVLDKSIPLLPIRVLSKGLLFLTIHFMILWSHVAQKERVDKLFWKNMIESELCPRQLFVYSTKDELTDSKKVDELIELRKKRGIELTAVKFEDSDHVLHMKEHPKEYNEKIINYVLDFVTNERNAQKSSRN